MIQLGTLRNVIEAIQYGKRILVKLIDFGAIQYYILLFSTIYGMMTACDITFIIFGHMDWFVSQIWTYGLIILWIERVSIWFIHPWITSNTFDYGMRKYGKCYGTMCHKNAYWPPAFLGQDTDLKKLFLNLYKYKL